MMEELTVEDIVKKIVKRITDIRSFNQDVTLISDKCIAED